MTFYFLLCLLMNYFGVSCKKIPREKSEAGRTFPFLSMPNEACNWLSLAKTHRTFSRSKVSFVDHLPLHLINLTQWRALFWWQIVICESVVSAVDVSAKFSHLPFEESKDGNVAKLTTHKCICTTVISDLRLTIRENLPFLYLPFLDVKATWHHALLLFHAFENRFGRALYNAK